MKQINFTCYHEPPQEISKEAIELVTPRISKNIEVYWNPRLPTGDVMEWLTKPHKESEKER
jgi:hypothetical protein